MKHDIEDLAADTLGVKQVENRILVSAPGAGLPNTSEGTPARALPDPEPPHGSLGSLRHQEWLLDESIEESFPASDTPSSVQPGSLAAEESSLVNRSGSL